MGGGLIQLMAYGAQDIYLTGNPQITFFKLVATRHTNFSMEYIRNYFVNVPTFNTTTFSKMSIDIDRNGDLMSDSYLVLDLPNIYASEADNFHWIDNIGNNFIRSAEVFIGGASIDKHYGQWMNIWTELSYSETKMKAYTRIIGGDDDEDYDGVPDIANIYHGNICDNTPNDILKDNNGDDEHTTTYPSIRKKRLYIPLQFWFCINPGLALPLISLQYTPVRIDFEIRPMNELFTISKYNLSPNAFFDMMSGLSENEKKDNPDFTEILNPEATPEIIYCEENIFWKYVNGTIRPENWAQNTYLDINYIFLDNDERTKFAYSTNEYIIPQIERYETSGMSGNKILELYFQHPVQELIWVFQRSDVNRHNDWNNYTNVEYSKDWNEFHKRIEFSREYYNSGLSAFSDFNEFLKMTIMPTILPSGISCNDFIKEINNSDMNKSSEQFLDAFDNLWNIMYELKIKFNGEDRNQTRDSTFYDAMESYKYHTNSARGIYKYSFSLHPEEISSSGHVNLSRIDRLEFEFLLRQPPMNDCEEKKEGEGRIYQCGNPYNYDYNMYVYARGYNILRIMNGIGATVFAN